jgi:hypothetical protein
MDTAWEKAARFLAQNCHPQCKPPRPNEARKARMSFTDKD